MRRWTRYWLEVTIVLLTVGYPWSNGYRFTSDGAIAAYRYRPDGAVSLGSWDYDWGRVYLLEDAVDWHLSVLCLRRQWLVLWRCRFAVPENEAAMADPVRTIGWVAWRGHGEQVTLMVIRSRDPAVVRVAAGPPGSIQQAAVTPDRLVVLEWPETVDLRTVGGGARDAAGRLLYHYLDPDGRHTPRWLPPGAQPHNQSQGPYNRTGTGAPVMTSRSGGTTRAR